MSAKRKPLRLTKDEDKLIDELSRTKAVKEMARIVKARLTKTELTNFIATYFFFSARGREEEAVNYFIKDRFMPLFRMGVTGFFDLLPELVTDPHFLKIMVSLYGKRFSLKKLFK